MKSRESFNRFSKIANLLLGEFNRRATFAYSILVLVVVFAVGVASAQPFESFVIRENGIVGAPVIQPNTVYHPDGLEFIIAAGGQKAGLGSSAIDGNPLGSIGNLSIVRLDDRTRFLAGSGPYVAPYFNIWITDGTNYAVVANEPSNPAFQPLYSGGYNLSWDDIKDKDAKVYENADLSWLPAQGSSANPAQAGRQNPSSTKLYTFADLAGYMIKAPTVAELTAGWAGLGSGAPDELGTYRAWGVNWVFGDTLSSYVSGDEGYVVVNASVSLPAPTLACVGFEPPMNLAYLPPALGGGVIARRVKRNRVFPFKAMLVDADGNAVTNITAPKIEVFWNDTPLTSVNVTDEALVNGKRTTGTDFFLAGDKWHYNLASRGFLDAGNHKGIMVSGDPSEYVIDPTCEGVFVIEP